MCLWAWESRSGYWKWLMLGSRWGYCWVSELVFGLACSYYTQQRYDDALKHFSKAAATASEGSELQANSRLGTGNSLYSKAAPGDRNEEDLLLLARAAYQDALKMKPDSEDAKYNLAVLERRLSSLREPNPDQAQQPPKQDPMTIIRDSRSSSAAQVARRREPVDQDW